MSEQCERNDEVLAIARSGGWPDRADDELLGHVATCVTCGDLATVAGAFAEDFGRASLRAAVPPSGAVWWRIQRRKRLEAEKAARRIITAVQGLSIVAGAIAVLLLVPALSSASLAGFFGGAADFIRGAVASIALPLLIAGAALVALTPVALVLALRD